MVPYIGTKVLYSNRRLFQHTLARVSKRGLPGLREPGATRLVLVRHGESESNASNRFAGWVDLALTPRGVEEARQAGRTLARAGSEFDGCHTSLLKRAHPTLGHLLDELDCTWLPVTASWHLNDRHYGDEQVRLWGPWPGPA